MISRARRVRIPRVGVDACPPEEGTGTPGEKPAIAVDAALAVIEAETIRGVEGWLTSYGVNAGQNSVSSSGKKPRPASSRIFKSSGEYGDENVGLVELGLLEPSV